jgi:triosephosphate isomerase (TIM)
MRNMENMMRKLAAGNWKMNGLAASLAEVKTLAAVQATCEVLLCPPATLIAQMVWAAKGSAVQVGGQDCHTNASGAHTGDVSAQMLADAGAAYVILGHSERRADHAETNDLVHAKAQAARAAGLISIICVGETLVQREAGETLDVIAGQMASVPVDMTAETLVLAYEPVWAIGTGLTPTIPQIAEVHAFLRARLADRIGNATGVRLLYGGSVKPSNAAEIFAVPHVDGALVGGASLKAADFGAIVAALSAS